MSSTPLAPPGTSTGEGASTGASTGDGPARVPSARRHPGAVLAPGRLLFLLLAGQFMALLDASIVNVAAPTLRADLHASGAGLQLIIAGYTIAYAVLLITGSRLGDRLGYGRTFRLGLAVFTLASLGCGLAPSAGTLIAFRMVQGAGAALMVPQVISLIQRTFTGPARVRALGAYTAVLAGGIVAGQVLGGVLVGSDVLGAVLPGSAWRPAFAVNVPIGIVLLLATRRGLPSGGGDVARRLDLPGLTALAAAVLLLVVPLVLGQEEHWPVRGWLMLGASAVTFAVFVAVQRGTARRGGHPLIHPELFAAPGLAAAATAVFLVMVGVGGIFLALTLHLQAGLGHGPLASGLLLVPMAAGFGLGGLHWRRLPAAWHPALPAVALLVAVLGYLVLGEAVASGGPVGVEVLAVTAVLGAAAGATYGPLMATALRGVQPRQAADASGVIVTLVQLGQVVGLATLGSLFLGSVTGPGPQRTGHGLELVSFAISGLSLVALLPCLLLLWRSGRRTAAVG